MKKAFLAIVVAVILTAGYSPRSVTAQQLPPHEDPRAVGSQFNAVSMLGYLGLIMEVLSSRDYAESADLLEQLRHANLPEDLRFIVDRFAELLGNLRSELESGETALVKATDFLNLGDRPAAKTELESAERSLSDARRSLQDLQPATEALGRRFGAIGPNASGRLREAYDELGTLLITLDELWDQYFKSLAQLEAYLAAPEASDILVPFVEPPVAQPTPIPRVELIAADPSPITIVESPVADSAAVVDSADAATPVGRFNKIVILAIVTAAASYMAGALIVTWRRRLDRRKGIVADNPAVPGAVLSGGSDTESPTSPPDWAFVESNTSRRRVVSAYHRAAQFLASSLAVAYEPYFTLRDFLLAIGSRMTKTFDELTKEAEEALYASEAKSEESVLRAEALANAVQEEGA